MRLPFAAVLCCGFALLAGGCADDPSDAPQLGSSASAIIGGSLDASRSAVVAILGANPARATCTGTIIATAPAASAGWVLTAAHCVGSASTVILGPDFSAPSAIALPIAARFIHPSYSAANPIGSTDVGILRLGVLPPGAVTPIPVVSQEIESLKVLVGSGVVQVGYGMRKTGTASSGNGPNTSRISIAKTIALVGGDRFETTYVAGGPCHGDEGGPALVTANGADALVATSWFMTQDCMGRAVSLRAHVFAPWVASIIASERARLGAYGSADGVVGSGTVGGFEDAGVTVVVPDAGPASGPNVVAAEGQLAVMSGGSQGGADASVDAAPRYAGADVSLPGTSACSVSAPAFTDTVAIWTALALVVGLARRRLSR